MRTVFFILILFLPSIFFGQDAQLRQQVDSIVVKIDSRSSKSISFTTNQKIATKNVTYFYSFKRNNGNIDYIERKFANRDSSVLQRFYSIGESIVFATESIIHYYGNDSVGWSGSYYFSGGILKDYVTLGHGKSEDEFWDPEKEVLINYRRAKKDVQVFLKK